MTKKQAIRAGLCFTGCYASHDIEKVTECAAAIRKLGYRAVVVFDGGASVYADNDYFLACEIRIRWERAKNDSENGYLEAKAQELKEALAAVEKEAEENKKILSLPEPPKVR
jgi:hypothetical protein